MQLRCLLSNQEPPAEGERNGRAKSRGQFLEAAANQLSP